MTSITARDLRMVYRVPIREEGLKASFISLFNREYKFVEAVNGITFNIKEGEVVGFIGPNGAGKTTTLKMLSGILHPTSGDIDIYGYTPWKREYSFMHQIAMIRGSRPISAPGELILLDALSFQKHVYNMSNSEYINNLNELTEMLDLGPILKRQIRGLSLGEKMRAGLAWSLLYRPKILFLDEPTLGLDVVAVSMMRNFISNYSKKTNATIILTSHYMADVKELCKRVIFIDKGCLSFDGSLDSLTKDLTSYKLLKISPGSGEQPQWDMLGNADMLESGEIMLQIPREKVNPTINYLLSNYSIADLSVEEPPLENIINMIYTKGLSSGKELL